MNDQINLAGQVNVEGVEPATDSPAERLTRLCQRRQTLLTEVESIDQEIMRLSGMDEIRRMKRPEWQCKRCGHRWKGNLIHRAPKVCARCHSIGWMDDPESANSRRPTDPPNPRWNKPKLRRSAPIHELGPDISPAPMPTLLRSPAIPSAPPPTIGEGARELPPPPKRRLVDQLRARQQDESQPERVAQMPSVPNDGVEVSIAQDGSISEKEKPDGPLDVA